MVPSRGRLIRAPRDAPCFDLPEVARSSGSHRCRVWGLEIGVWGLGLSRFGVWELGVVVWISQELYRKYTFGVEGVVKETLTKGWYK